MGIVKFTVSGATVDVNINGVVVNVPNSFAGFGVLSDTLIYVRIATVVTEIALTQNDVYVNTVGVDRYYSDKDAHKVVAVLKDQVFTASSGGGSGTVATAADVNAGTDNTKFVSPAALAGSKYNLIKRAKIGSQSQRKMVGYGARTSDGFDPAGLSDGTQTIETSRLKYKAIGDISDVSCIFWNGIRGSRTVVTPANSITITGSIEYTYTNEAGSTSTVIKPFTFFGATSVLIPWNRSFTSDVLQIEIPAGTFFWIRTCVTVTSGQKWYKGQAVSSTYNEGSVAGSDATVSGTITDGTALTLGPLAVIGTSSARQGAVWILGDSIAAGQSDSGYTQYSYNAGGGVLGRSFQNIFPGVHTEHVAIQFEDMTPNARNQMAVLLGAADFFIDQLGINNISGTLANMQAKAISIWDSFLARGVYGYRTTLTPSTTGTFTSAGGQTVTANESKRTGFNDWIRDGAPIDADSRAAQTVGSTGTNTVRAGQNGHALLGYFETADVAETARNSGIWKSPSGVAWTGDGLHPNTTSYPLLAAAIDTTKFLLW